MSAPNIEGTSNQSSVGDNYAGTILYGDLTPATIQGQAIATGAVSIFGGALNTNGVIALQTAQISALTTTGAAVFNTSQVDYLSTTQLSALVTNNDKIVLALHYLGVTL